MRTVIAKPEIMTVLQNEGVELRQRGGRLWGLCPFHSEKTPSFCVNTDKQHWRCFGACATGGDVISLVRKLKGLTFPGALRYLGISGGDSRPARPSPEELRRREAVRRFRRWEQLMRRALSELVRLANRIDLNVTKPEDLERPGVGEMYLAKFVYEYYLDILNSDDDKQKFLLYERVAYGNN